MLRYYNYTSTLSINCATFCQMNAIFCAISVTSPLYRGVNWSHITHTHTLALSLYCFLMWLQVSEYKCSLLWPTATAALSKSFFTDTLHGGSQNFPKLSFICRRMVNKLQHVSFKLFLWCQMFEFEI